MSTLPQLDVLIYAHDGRGLGHISRSIAIGLSIRRLFPKLKVAVITGSPFAQMLTNMMPLEIIKLPSYQVKLYNGKSYEAQNNINIKNKQLAQLRSKIICNFVSLSRPKCILVDHLPLGKKMELREAQKITSKDCIWILGLRAVLGDVIEIRPHNWTKDSTKAYKYLFWYGDSNINSLDLSRKLVHPNLSIEEMNYVSRAYELERWSCLQSPVNKRSGCVVSFSLLSDTTVRVLYAINDLLKHSGDKWGKWNMFLGRDLSGGKAASIILKLSKFKFCTVNQFSNYYLDLLPKASLAIVCGGYNTLTDLLWAKTPAVILARSQLEKEQLVHTEYLSRVYTTFETLPENEITVSCLHAAMTNVVNNKKINTNIKLTGSEITARRINQIIDM